MIKILRIIVVLLWGMSWSSISAQEEDRYSNEVGIFNISTSQDAFAKALPERKILFIYTSTQLTGATKALIDMLAHIQQVGIAPNQVDVCILNTNEDQCKKMFRKDVRFVSFRQATRIHYSCVVSYSECIDPQLWVKRIKAKKRIQWLHIDLLKSGWNLALLKRSHCTGIDRFVCVSEKVKEGFKKLHPDLASKASTIYCIVDGESIKRRTAEPVVDMPREKKCITIVSIGRLTEQKGIDRAIRVHKVLADNGYPVRWYVIGDGEKRNKFKAEIIKNGLQKKFILLGLKSNPYPYLQRADIFALFSRYEGFCLCIAEAKLLQKPIIVTNFAGAREQIVSEYNGLIVEQNEEKIYLGLKKLIDDAQLREKFSANLAGFEYDNSVTLDQLRELFAT